MHTPFLACSISSQHAERIIPESVKSLPPVMISLRRVGRKIITQGTKSWRRVWRKKKVKKKCGHSEPQMWFITECMDSLRRIWFCASNNKIITAVMKSCIAVMKFITARDVLIHYGGYDFMPSEKSIFRMPDPLRNAKILRGPFEWGGQNLPSS